MKIDRVSNPFLIFSPIWEKYSEYFDKSCWGIWGLAPLLKFTLLVFFLFVVPLIFGVASVDDDLYIVPFFIFLLVILLIWALYLPIFFAILLKRGILKAIELSKKSTHYLVSEPNYFETKNPDNLEIVIRNLRYHWWTYFHKLVYKHRRKLTAITEIYPFSNLFQNKMFHARNQIIWKTMNKIQSVARNGGVPIRIKGINTDPYFHFSAYFTKTKHYPIKKLERALQKHFGTIYVRKLDKSLIQINTTIGEDENN